MNVGLRTGRRLSRLACLSSPRPARTAASRDAGGERMQISHHREKCPGAAGLRERERSYVSQHARQSRRRRARRSSPAGPLLSMPPSKCTAILKWIHNLTTRATCWRSDVKWPRRTLDALLRKRYALICPYETLHRLDIDREDIMSSTFRARTTYPPPEVALSPLIVHIGPERAGEVVSNERPERYAATGRAATA